ncbi:ribonuclease T2 family protein [Rhodovulum sp. DZ06]|uniref:ribonuclease T2 family protein n=1 Tax=Rhodovulum sp. DZ06 TaxID=3425126 RepID=UPI003D337EBD
MRAALIAFALFAALPAALPAALRPAAAAAESTSATLALTWAPAFCETRRTRPRECAMLDGRDLPVWTGRFTLHGLWPNGGEYCGVEDRIRFLDKKGAWNRLPMPPMGKTLRTEILRAMPGALSDLHRHEWTKHGTCHRAPGGAAEYFEDALFALRAVNRSGIAALMRERVGGRVHVDELRAALDETYGAGAGARLQMICEREEKGERVLVREIRLSLNGKISPYSDFGQLLHDAHPRKKGCSSGIVDAQGEQ